MKILIADKFPESHQQALIERGHEVVFEPDLGGDDLPAKISDFNMLLVRSTQVSAETVGAAKDLKLIIRAGAGTNTIDKAAANQAGIHVCNTPGMNSVAVAELAMGMLLAIDRRIADNVAQLREGRWNKKEFSKAEGIKGKTLGIAGMGAIGQALAKRALAFEMKVLGYDVVPFDAPGVDKVDTLEQLLERADAVSLHVPMSDATKHLINAERLALMKPGAILLHTARGGVVDEQALIAAIKEKGLRVGVDVYEDEPAASDKEYNGELGKLPGVVGTHHIGASTAQAQAAVADEVLAVVDAYVKDGSFRNEVKA